MESELEAILTKFALEAIAIGSDVGDTKVYNQQREATDKASAAITKLIETARIEELEFVKKSASDKPYTDVLLNDVEDRLTQLKQGAE